MMENDVVYETKTSLHVRFQGYDENQYMRYDSLVQWGMRSTLHACKLKSHTSGELLFQCQAARNVVACFIQYNYGLLFTYYILIYLIILILLLNLLLLYYNIIEII